MEWQGVAHSAIWQCLSLITLPGPVRAVNGLFWTKIVRLLTGPVPYDFCPPPPLRWPGETFPAFPAHAQPAIVRIWKEAHGMTSPPCVSWVIDSSANILHTYEFCYNILKWKCRNFGAIFVTASKVQVDNFLATEILSTKQKYHVTSPRHWGASIRAMRNRHTSVNYCIYQT